MTDPETHTDDGEQAPGGSGSPEADTEETQAPPPPAEEAPAEPEPTPEESAAQEEARHAHFLANYEPVLTRLPDALGTAPEREFVPADAPEEHEREGDAEPPAADAED